MSGKIYNKNLTFLQDQPFAENLLTGFYYKKRRGKLPSRTDSFLAKQMLNSEIKPNIGADTLLSSTRLALLSKKQSTRVSFGSTLLRNKSEKMRKAEASLVKHFCLILERFSCNQESGSLSTRVLEQRVECSSELRLGKIIPHLLASVDSMQNTLLATRNSRSTERIKAPSQFKKILRESRKIRLLYGNLSRRHLSRGISKVRFPGETLLIWLESRLDVVLERCGFFGSVKAARQSVLSGNIMVNSKVVKSPGFVLEGGDIIKVIQKKLLLNPLVNQFSRGVIISNEVFPYLYRKKYLVHALSNILQKSKSTSYLIHSLTSNKINKDFRNIVDKNFVSSRLQKREFSPYNSFYTWLLKKKKRNFQSSEIVGRQSNASFDRELQLKKVSSLNTIGLDKKILSLKIWRFIGSPHLLFSLFFLHGHLQKVISFLAHLCKKGVSLDKAFVKLFSYKAQEYNNKSRQKRETTHYYFNLLSFVLYRTYLNLPTIFFTSKECMVNTFTSNTSSSSIPMESKCMSLIKQKEGCLHLSQENKSRLSLLLANLLLYSLLIKKELAFLLNREWAQFEKEQVQLNNKKVSGVSPASIISNKKQKSSNSRLSQVTYKKFNSNQRVEFNTRERIKPLHLEVSYQSLCAVFLFPPQRVCLPVMVDLDCLAKSL